MTERKSTIHCRDSKGRIMSPSKCPPEKKRTELRYISVVSSALVLGVIALGVMLSVTAGRSATLANSLENQYQLSYHDFTANVESIINNEDVELNAHMAIANLTALPVKSENTTETIALLNKIAKEGTENHMEELGDLYVRLVGFSEANSEYRFVDNLNDAKRKQRVTKFDKAFTNNS